MRAWIPIVLAACLLGCRGHLEITIPSAEPGQPAVAVIEGTFWGKGCTAVMYGDYLLLAEQDGASMNISGLFRSFAAIVGSVFGASQQQTSDRFENGEGCRGLLVDPEEEDPGQPE